MPKLKNLWEEDEKNTDKTDFKTMETKSGSSKLHIKSGKPTDLKIAYVGGGSRGWANKLMGDLAQSPYINGEVRLYDTNQEMAEFNQKYGTWIQAHPKAVSNWKYRAVKTIKEALVDADFVFLSIQPGDIEAMGVDLLEPMKYGIYQPVGDTVGPGGSIRALRSAKDYFFFAESIKKYAPNAWCINFTNPMTVCTRSLYEVFPKIKAFGCCHEVFGTQDKLGKVFSEVTGARRPGREEIKIDVLGINHFTWITKAEYKGQDLIKTFIKYINKPEFVNKFGKSKVDRSKYKPLGGINTLYDPRNGKSEGQVCYELTRRFGVVAAAGDRHLAEFVPWFLTDEYSCQRFGFRLTPYAYRKIRFNQGPKVLRHILKAGFYKDLKDSGEEYINQMLAILGKTKFITNVNIPNVGQHDGIPLGAVVETNAHFSSAGVKPVYSGALPPLVNQLVMRHVANQEALVKAVRTKNEDLAFSAFVNDPLTSRIALDDAWKLFKTMVKKTKFSFK